ncbi:hypothetical protein FE257_008607 [Aspergillus nanangensis]|uniref:Major facilitator superfamily (MFS) profile domain-containing protein n=1 Tax=Aspergillus nanangensis TaxID=2582783 RepID=A0AAD4CL12_ASPNN|nr:hypothetical protein FE257_008607 [Aspergillus nanangensis]
MADLSVQHKPECIHIDDISSADGPENDRPEQRKIISRIDRRLLPICGLITSVSLIDRTNVSNAAIAGMNEDLHLDQGTRYSVMVLVFFVTYTLAQIPSNAIVRRIGTRWVISSLILAWGIVTIGFGLTTSWKQLVALRVVLGLFEGGSFPSIILLMSTWYVRYELQKRYAGYYLLGITASAFSGILAYGLTQMDGVGGLQGWRWIFIIEGILTCIVAVLAYIFLLEFPDREPQSQPRWGRLGEVECQFTLQRLSQDRGDASLEPFSWRAFLRSALQVKTWAFATLFLAATAVAYSMAYFLPIILHHGMGFGVAASQCLVAPPYAFAAILMFAGAWAGDKYHVRGPIIIFNSILAIVGLAMMGYAASSGAQYAGVFFVAAGVNASIPAIMAYQANNIRGQWNRAFASASLIGFGGIGGIVGGAAFQPSSAPRYIPGIWTSIALMLLVIGVVLALTVYFIVQNRRADRQGTILEGLEGFRYTI